MIDKKLRQSKEFFPFNHLDIVSFEDTESEYVDVGFGPNCGVKVAETNYNTLLIVLKRFNGFTLRFFEDNQYSETFGRKSKYSSKYISLKEFLIEFGDFKSLKYIGTYNTKTKEINEIQ